MDIGSTWCTGCNKEERANAEENEAPWKAKAVRTREDRLKPTAPNEAWSMDYVMYKLQDGTRFRVLTIVDVYTEAVTIEAGQSLKGDDVVRTLNRLRLDRGVPKVCSATIDEFASEIAASPRSHCNLNRSKTNSDLGMEN